MATWPDLPINTDVDAVVDNILDGLIGQLPGYVPREGDPLAALAEEIGREEANTRQLLIEAVRLAVAGIGETVFDFAVQQAEPATIDVDLTVVAAGSLVPAGFTVVGRNPDGTLVAFVLDDAVTTTGTTQTVTMTAQLPGEFGNDVPDAQDLIIARSTATVVSAATGSVSLGGRDAESITTYLSRLRDYLSVLRPGGVLAADVAALARSVPGVYRAVALDNYDALADDTDVDKTVTVYVVDENGQPVAPDVQADVIDAIAATREPNFDVYVRDPEYTDLTIAFTAVAETGADPDTVEDNIIAALEAYLSPAAWGSTGGDPESWTNTLTVARLDLARVAGSADGVAQLLTLTLNGGTADVTLDGRVGLPAADPTITGSVS